MLSGGMMFCTTEGPMLSGDVMFCEDGIIVFFLRFYQHTLVCWIFPFSYLLSRARLGDQCWNGD